MRYDFLKTETRESPHLSSIHPSKWLVVLVLNCKKRCLHMQALRNTVKTASVFIIPAQNNSDGMIT